MAHQFIFGMDQNSILRKGIRKVNKDHYQSALLSSTTSLRYLKMLVLVMAISLMMLVYHIMTLQYSEKTILIPANFNQSISIDGNDLSDTYVMQIGRYLTGLGYTFNPDNARAQFNELLTYFSPALYAQFDRRFEVDHRRIQKSQIGSVLHISNVEIHGNNGYFFGTSEGYIGSKKVSSKPIIIKVGLAFDGVLSVIDYGEFMDSKNARGEARFVRVKPEVE